MAKYVTLYIRTDQGAATAKDTVNRYQAAKQLVESKGGRSTRSSGRSGPMTSSRFRVPDEETGTAVSLQLASTATSARRRCARSQKAWMMGIIEKMG